MPAREHKAHENTRATVDGRVALHHVATLWSGGQARAGWCGSEPRGAVSSTVRIGASHSVQVYHNVFLEISEHEGLAKDKLAIVKQIQKL